MRTTRRHTSNRSPSPSSLCHTVTLPGKRAAKRRIVCGVSAISGTRTTACLPCASACRNGAQVDLGLARTGDAVEQEAGLPRARRRPRHGGSLHLTPDPFLVRRQRGRRIQREIMAGQRIPPDHLFGDADQARRLEVAQAYPASRLSRRRCGRSTPARRRKATARARPGAFGCRVVPPERVRYGAPAPG